MTEPVYGLTYMAMTKVWSGAIVRYLINHGQYINAGNEQALKPQYIQAQMK